MAPDSVVDGIADVMIGATSCVYTLNGVDRAATRHDVPLPVQSVASSW